MERKLTDSGVRTLLAGRNEKLGFKIREAELQKIPIMLVVGDQEQANGTVMPRHRLGSQAASEALPVDALMAQLLRDISERRNTRRS